MSTYVVPFLVLYNAIEYGVNMVLYASINNSVIHTMLYVTGWYVIGGVPGRHVCSRGRRSRGHSGRVQS